MPLDVNCPKCQKVFPVTEARHAVGVECPGCDAELIAEFRKRAAPDPGQHPYELFVSAGRPPGSPPVSPGVKALRLDDDDDDAARSGGSASVVIGAGLGALVVALASLAAIGYALFTNLDTSDSTIANASRSGNTTDTSGNNASGLLPGRDPFPAPKLGNPGGFGNRVEPKGNNGFKAGFPGPASFPPGMKAPVDRFDLKPVAGQAQRITPPPLDLSTPVTRTLPGRAEAVTVGGNGRFLIFYIGATRQLTVFDANTSGFSATETIPARGQIFLAGGRNRVVTCDMSSRILRSYSLPDLRQEFEFPYPLFHFAAGIAMGPATNGPLLVVDTFGDVVLVDLTDSGATVVEGSQSHQNLGLPFQMGGRVRALPNGRGFLVSRSNHPGEPTGLLTEQGGKWKPATVGITTASPGSDSSHLFGFRQIVDAASGKAIGKEPTSPVWYVGGVSGRAFLRLAETKANNKQALSISAHAGDPASAETDPNAVSIGVLPETEGLIDWFGGIAAALDEHLFLIAEARMLVVMPRTRDRIVLRKVDVK